MSLSLIILKKHLFYSAFVGNDIALLLVFDQYMDLISTGLNLMKSKSLPLPLHRFTRVLFITSKTFDPVLITDKTLKKKWLKQDSQALTLRRRQLRLRRLRPTFVSIRPTSALFLAYSKSLHWSVPIHHCLYLSNKLLIKISHHSSSFKRRVWISWASFASWFPSTIGIRGPTGSTFAPWEDSGSRVSC